MSGAASRDRGGGPLVLLLGCAGAAGYIGCAWLEIPANQASGGPGGRVFADGAAAVVLGTALGGFSLAVFRKDHGSCLVPTLLVIVGPALTGLALAYVLRIYGSRDGILRGAVFLAAVKGNDIAAYVVGHAFGRTRFLAVSPRKTLEGCAAALLVCTGWVACASWLWPDAFFPWPLSLLVGIILSAACQIGDYAESLLKRCFQVKDSSRLLPEFGGALDLIDSFFFAGIIFWWALT